MVERLINRIDEDHIWPDQFLLALLSVFKEYLLLEGS